MKFRKILCAMLAALMAFTLFACTDKKPTPPAKVKPVRPYSEYNYTPEHLSETRELKFYSSDEDLAHVFTDYNMRHMRYDIDNQIHNFPIGEGRTDWKEWEAMSGSWWNATNDYLYNWNGKTNGLGYGTKDIVTHWLLHPNLDAQGYVMPDDGKENTWGLGWEFPAQENLGGYYCDFLTSTDGWHAVDDCGATVTGGDSVLYAQATNATEIALSPEVFSRVPIDNPFIQMKFSVDLLDGTSGIDDMYIYFATDSSREFNEEKCVKFSTFSLQGFALDSQNKYDWISCFFPMYVHEKWGRGFEEVTDIKVVLKAKAGQTISGTFMFDFIGCEWDDRHVINNCNYLIAAKEIVSFSQDQTILREVMPHARRALNFMYHQLGGKSGLISTAYLVGHNNGDKDYGDALGDGYWDISAFPDKNAYINISYYNALKSLLYLERMCEENNISIDTVYTRNEQMNGRYEYEFDADDIAALLELCRTQFQEYFWNETTGRFHVGYRHGGSIQDNGYLMFNEQAVAAGIPTEAQTEKIMEWINGDRTVAGDLSSGDDIYLYEFAPRFCTAELNPDVYSGSVSRFGTNVNNGGTALQLAYYDFVAQAKYNIESATKRLDTFVQWYKKVEAAGGTGWNFYRDYYGNTIKLQGGGTGGVIGVDYEFLEASIVTRAIPDAFFGMETLSGNTFKLAPNMPFDIDYLRIENITYNNCFCDVAVGQFFVCLSGVTPYSTVTKDATLRVDFEKPAWDFAVYVDGEEISKDEGYTVEGNVVRVETTFENCKVEIKKI